MKINHLLWERSEKNIHSRITVWQWVLNWIKLLFSADIGPQTLESGNNSPGLNVVAPQPTVNNDVLGSNSVLHKECLIYHMVRKALQQHALISSNGLYSRHRRKIFRRGADIVAKKLLFIVFPVIIPWRNWAGWRGPPWTLFAARLTVCLQE